MALRRRKKAEERKPQLMEGQDDTSFRRSRTMQGSTSSNVKTTKQKRPELSSDRLKKQQQARLRKLILTGLAIIVVVIFGIWYLASQYTVAVGEVTYTPATTSQPDSSLYKEAIAKYMGSRPAERFRFAINQERLTQFVADTLPEVQNVQVNGGSSNNTDFKLTLRQPIAGWKTGSSQSFVDEQGVSFTNNYFAKPGVVITDNSGAKNEGGESNAVVSERFLRFLGRLVALTNSSGLGTVTEASLPKNTAREIDIKIKGRPYYIKTHIDRDPAATVEDIKRVVGYLEQKNITPSYIDVRVSGRAFYK